MGKLLLLNENLHDGRRWKRGCRADYEKALAAVPLEGGCRPLCEGFQWEGTVIEPQAGLLGGLLGRLKSFAGRCRKEVQKRLMALLFRYRDSADFDAREAIRETLFTVEDQMNYLDISLSLTCRCREQCCMSYGYEDILPCHCGFSVVHGGGDEFKYVLLHLLLNAQDAIMEKREKSGTEERGNIAIHLCCNQDKVVLKVHDNGENLSEELLERACASIPHCREEVGRRGTRLYFSKKLIEARMSGSLHVCNEGEGVLFTLEFHTVGFCGNEIPFDTSMA